MKKEDDSLAFPDTLDNVQRYAKSYLLSICHLHTELPPSLNSHLSSMGIFRKFNRRKSIGPLLHQSILQTRANSLSRRASLPSVLQTLRLEDSKTSTFEDEFYERLTPYFNSEVIVTPDDISEVLRRKEDNTSSSPSGGSITNANSSRNSSPGSSRNVSASSSRASSNAPSAKSSLKSSSSPSTSASALRELCLQSQRQVSILQLELEKLKDAHNESIEEMTNKHEATTAELKLQLAQSAADAESVNHRVETLEITNSRLQDKLSQVIEKNKGMLKELNLFRAAQGLPLHELVSLESDFSCDFPTPVLDAVDAAGGGGDKQPQPAEKASNVVSSLSVSPPPPATPATSSGSSGYSAGGAGEQDLTTAVDPRLPGTSTTSLDSGVSRKGEGVAAESSDGQDKDSLHFEDSDLVQLAQTFYGSRYIQNQIDTDSTPDRPFFRAFFAQMKGSLKEVMVSKFGRFTFEKVLPVCSEAQKLEILQALTPNFTTVAADAHGSFGIQLLVKSLDPNNQAQIQLVVAAIRGSIDELVTGYKGHYLVLLLISNFSYDSFSFIDDTIRNIITSVCTNNQGLQVMKAMLKHRTPEQILPTLTSMVPATLDLVQDQFGNYVLQQAILYPSVELDAEEPDLPTIGTRLRDVKVAFLTEMVTKFRDLSKGKFSSNCIEMILRSINSPRWIASIIAELIAPPATAVQKLVNDRFGNYVIQTALSVANASQVDDIKTALAAHFSNFRPNLRVKWDKLIAQAEARVAVNPHNPVRKLKGDLDTLIPAAAKKTKGNELAQEQEQEQEEQQQQQQQQQQQ
eukprot:CAMPEP_0175139078 /NCGR_PEP_ID=MMETSP0087-20121206/10697_1 /TAXON_ID=136419 /ORGANISM="Unknown Unknown, Strain D1" /LENGTH=800 /DNA_ID=CAMNT_0016422037 /DNA_START=241 /DNA_END=2641 /DNA_ORIENTATION=-